MNKTVVLSTNDNDDYLFFLPIVAWAWIKFGWNVAIMELGIKNTDKSRLIYDTLFENKNGGAVDVFELRSIGPVRDTTIVQCSRMYAANKYSPEMYLMTGDIDMLPLSNYWKFNPDFITAWGHDLTGFVHYPMCYVGARAGKWKQIMGLTGDMYADIQRDMGLYPKSLSNNWEEWWQVDQDILTDRLNHEKIRGQVHKVLRGTAPNGYPLGRIDRGCWDVSLAQQTERIDAHLLRPGYSYFNFEKILALIRETFPGEDISWMQEYKNKYINFVK